MKWSKPTREEAARLMLVAATDGEDGELLKFSNAVLARAETNRNGDAIDESGLSELASTLPLMPLDDEHVADRVVGIFVSARASDGALLTDGIVFASRFPDVVRDITSGDKKLSVEALAARARCSVCGEVFDSPKDYCPHLTGRPSSGAVRILSGLKAIGGGTVRNNAGTNTTFDRNGFVLLASLEDGGDVDISASEPDDTSPVDSGCGENKRKPKQDADASKQSDGEKDMAQLDELTATLEKVQATLAERESALAARDAEIKELNDKVSALQASHEQEVSAMRVGFQRREELISAGYGKEEVDALAGKLETTDDGVYNALLASVRKAAELGSKNAVTASAEPVDGGGDAKDTGAKAEPHKVLSDQGDNASENPFSIFK